jgi:thiopeptide-type bacteriocin biosynthesis protein
MSKKRALGAHPQGSFALRAPLLAFDELASLSDGLQAPASPEGIAEAIDRDIVHTRALLQDAYRRPEVREALFLASPKLEAGLDAWLADEPGGPPTKYEQALLRYFARMSSRPTPFGLFAGVATGTLGGRTEVSLGAIGDHGRRTRPDMHFLTALVEAIEALPEIARSLVLRPNSSLCRVGGRLRFAAHSMRGQRRSYRLVALDETPALSLVLDRARDGCRVNELAALLVGDDVTIEDATGFVLRLVSEQVLVGDLAPPLTGDDPVRAMIAGLYSVPGAEPIAGMIERCRVELEKLDAEGIGIAPARYRALADQLEGAPVEIELARLFQTDLALSTDTAILGDEFMAVISEGVWATKALMTAPRNDALARWRAAFVQRYEGREVALAEALDEELGIGFEMSSAPAAEASPLLKGLAFPTGEPELPAMSERGALLLRRLHATIAAGARILSLSDADIEALRGSRPAVSPDAFGVLASVGRGADGTPRVLLQGAAGPPGAKLLARFCHADEDVGRLIEEHLRAEEALRPDALFAEIVHLPEGRTGNVLSRPVLRAHEIPYLGRSGASDEAVITIEDLFVSVAGDRIVLRSKRLGKEVLPRLTSAHNYTLSGLGVYRFLCELQSQQVADGIVWNWGMFDRAPFLPRVQYRRATLARARWRLDQDEIAELTAAAGVANRYEAVQRLRERRVLPRWMVLQDEDNELVVDLQNAFSVEMLLQLLKGRGNARLAELWPDPAELLVTGPNGRHTCEVVVPFVRSGEPRTARLPAPPQAARSSFVPGSEWLFAKIFTGTSTGDLLLRDALGPLVERLVEDGTASRWFFIRYSDPDWHLRVRMKGDPAALLSEVLPRLTSVIEKEIGDGRVWRFQLDTYEREVARYGGTAAMDVAEDIFHFDSDAAVAILRAAPGDAGMDARWKLALAGIDRIFQDFGLDPAARRSLARRQRDGYATEFGDATHLKKGIGARYRDVKDGLAAMLRGDHGGDRVIAEGLAILDERSGSNAAAIERISEIESAGSLSVPLDELAATLAHVWVNRVLRSAHRAQEYVIYDFLDRLYAAHEARSRRG